MTTKLTLSIKAETIERAKRISRMKGKSISRMVEEYFERLPESSEEGERDFLKLLALSSQIPSLPEHLKDLPYNEIIRQWRSDDIMENGS